MAGLTAVPEQIVAQAPAFKQLGDGLHQTAGGVSQGLQQAESAASNAQVANGIYALRMRWQIALTHLGDLCGGCGDALIVAAQTYGTVDARAAGK